MAFEDIMNKKDRLVRKPTDGTVLLAPKETATVINKNNLYTGSPGAKQIAVPTEYESCGWISEDGLTFASDIEVSDIRGWGSSTFIRRDIQSTDMTLQFSAIETRRVTKELVTGLDLRNTVLDTDGFLQYDIPDRMPTKEWSVLALATDGEGSGRYYMGKFFPRMTVNERDDETWTDGDDPLMYNVTMGALVDSNAGFVCREFLFGPGALAAATAMGWVTAAPLNAPSGVAAGTPTSTTVGLTWTAPSTGTAASYVVQISTNGGDSYATVASGQGGAPTTNSTTITGLTASTGYRFRVAGVGAGNVRGPFSSSIAVTTAAS